MRPLGSREEVNQNCGVVWSKENEEKGQKVV